LRTLLAFSVILLLCGCAVMDVSVMDTAEPLKKGSFKIETYANSGLVLESTVHTWEDDPDNPYMNIIWPVAGLKFGTGISDSSEVGVKGWLALGSYGGKAYYKYLLDRKGNVYTSIMPALTCTGVNNDSKYDYHEDHYDSNQKYFAIGAELPYLITNKLSEYVSFTAAARINYNYFRYQFVDENGDLIKHGPYHIVHGGILGNVRLKLVFLVLTPEIGVEVVPGVNNRTILVPNMGVTLGLQF
jgi:hypothetical protein